MSILDILEIERRVMRAKAYMPYSRGVVDEIVSDLVDAVERLRSEAADAGRLYTASHATALDMEAQRDDAEKRLIRMTDARDQWRMAAVQRKSETAIAERGRSILMDFAEKIANQKMSREFPVDHREVLDWMGGYDKIVEEARQAILDVAKI